ncbi:hypothetical protein [Mesonia aquimarina]|uniref:hypothetical protein n=1 Tax=Mesonia aquimarina TaxID=1504967 RepID=UPI000EF5798F|nr:hypothetical protein [Mesonia aquimarina]
MTKIILDNWQLISGAIASVFAFFGGRKLKKINEKKEEANALQTFKEVYDGMASGIKKEIEDIKLENREQRKTMRLLQEDNGKLHRDISQLMTENNQLKQMVAELKNENRILREKLKSKKDYGS